MRIVSVLPSATEIVCALGARDELVGRSAECDFPADVAELPIVMRPRTLDAERPSAEIDRRVARALSQGESLYALDVPLLRQLRPDVLLTQDLCGVCSVTEEEVRRACAEAGLRPEILSLNPRTLEEVWGSVEAVGRAIGRVPEGRSLAASLRERSAAAFSPERTARVAVVEWLDPPILAGLWTPDLIERAGGLAVGPRSGAPGERTSWPDLASRQPDLVVLSPCSFGVSRTARELATPALARALGGLAPRLGTFLADEAFFSRPGPRLVEGAGMLGALLRGGVPEYSLPTVRWAPAAAEGVS